MMLEYLQITLIILGIEDLILAPLDPSCVRANVIISGFMLTPVDEKTTKVTYIFQGMKVSSCHIIVDVSGWIPTSIVNQVNSGQVLSIIGIRHILTGSQDP